MYTGAQSQQMVPCIIVVALVKLRHRLRKPKGLLGAWPKKGEDV